MQKVVEMNGSRITQEQIGGKTIITRVDPLGERSRDDGKSSQKSPSQSLPDQRVKAFNGMKREDALKKFPELSGAYAALDAVSAKSRQQGLTEIGAKNAEIQARTYLSSQIQMDKLPQPPQQQQNRVVPQRSQDLER